METSRLLGIKYNVHGCLQKHTEIELTKISSKLHLPIHLMLFNVDGNMNIAMSIRTAAVLGCSDVWIVGMRKYDARPEVGSKNYIRVHKIPSINADTFFHEQGITPFLVEQGGTALESINFKPFMTKPVCFVMGSESHGIPPELLARSYPRVSISQCGMVRSLNVSIAASIILYEYIKQYRDAKLL